MNPLLYPLSYGGAPGRVAASTAWDCGATRKAGPERSGGWGRCSRAARLADDGAVTADAKGQVDPQTLMW